jgi:4-amino-4-deoxy-L-arabinose transferase-like glycosyltransferase
MTANDHNRLLGIFYTVLGAIISLCAFGLLAMPFVVTSANNNSNADVRFFIIFGIIILLLGLLPLTVGVGLLQQRSWARIGSIVTGILFIVNFPLGMALGIYTLIFMFSDRGKDLYTNPPSRPNW